MKNPKSKWAADLQRLGRRLRERGRTGRPQEWASLAAETARELERLAREVLNPGVQEPPPAPGKEQRLATFPEMNPNPVLEVERDGRISYANPATRAFLRQAGLPEEGRQFLPDDLEAMLPAEPPGGPLYREVEVGGRLFGENIYYAPEYDSFRLYATDITEHRRTLTELERRQAEITALLEASRAALREDNFQEAARAIFQQCKLSIGATAGYVSLVNEARQENEVVYLDPGGQPCRVPEETPMPIRGLRERAYRSGRAVYENRYGETEHARFLPEGHMPLANVLFGPLVVQGKTVGLLGLADKPGGFTDRDVRLAEAFGELGAVALVDKWARESLRRQQEELERRVRERTAALQEANAQLQEEIDKRRRAETVLMEQSHIIEAFFQDTVMPLVILDREFNFIRVNEAYARACGRRVEDFPGHNHFDFYPSEARAIFAEVVRTKKTFETRARPFVFPDYPEWGPTYWDWNLSPILDASGAVEFLVFSLRDVTAEVRARETQTRLSAIIEAAPDLVAIADTDYRVHYLNRAGRRLLGISEGEDIAGLRIPDTHPPDTWARLRDEALPAAQEAGFWQGETVFRDRGGGEIPVSQAILAHQTGDDAVQFFSTIARDITERKQAEAALQRERDFVSALLDTIGALVVVLDRDGRIVRFNQTCEQATGYRFDEVKDTPFWDVLLVQEEIALVKEVFQTLCDSAQASCLENYWLTKDGQRRWIAWSNTALSDDRGAVKYIISTGIDLTEERRLRQESEQRLAQIIQQDKLASLGEMVAGVAHEINNPNSFITYNVPLLQETWRLFEPILAAYGRSHPDWRRMGASLAEMCQDMQEIITAIKTGSERINKVVANLKDFARLDQSTVSKPVHVNEVIEQTLTIVEGQVRRFCPRIDLELAPGLPPVQGHFHKLEQVVINLLLNASQAIEERGRGRITIRTRYLTRLPAVAIAVEDNGKGMDAEVRRRIFEPFFTTRRTAGGTGLGLSVSHGLVKEHGGLIGVLSRPGVGTCFTIFLPVNPQASLELAPQVVYLGADRRCAEFLQSRFIKCVSAAPLTGDLNGVLRFLEEYPEVDVVLCDVSPADTDMEKFLAGLKERRPLLTLIVTCKEAGTATGVEGWAGADVILPGPGNYDQLVEIIRGIGRQSL